MAFAELIQNGSILQRESPSMERWTLAFVMGLPLALLQTAVSGSGGMAEMAGRFTGAALIYGLIMYGILTVGGVVCRGISETRFRGGKDRGVVGGRLSRPPETFLSARVWLAGVPHPKG